MDITFISDTHGLHAKLLLKGGDMIIHAGDVSSKGSLEEIDQFLNWFKDLDNTYKIFIAGNHDFYFEQAIDFEIDRLIPNDVIYLNDSGVSIEGIHFWGSPITPWFYDWAFNRQRGLDIKQHWDLIPYQTDVLITHGPPYSKLDKTISGQAVGCAELKEKINLIRPQAHVFGHIHEGYGQLDECGTQYINASVLDERYNLTNNPIRATIYPKVQT